MLYTVLILPTSIPSDPLSHDWDIILTIFRQVSINGLLLVDRQGLLYSKIRERIDRYAPPEKQVQFNELLKSLDKPEISRIWRHPEWNIDVRTFETINNIAFFKVLSRYIKIRIDLIITGINAGIIVEGETTISDDCPKDSSLEGRQQLARITPSIALSSKAFAEMCVNSYFIDAAGSRSVIDTILQPLFRIADHVDIYDRNIGSLARNHSNMVPPNYRDGLQELLYYYCSLSFQRDLTFNIYTYFDDNIDKSSVTSLLDDFIRRSSGALGANFLHIERSIEVNIWINRDRRINMRHNRYFCTNQVVIAVDKGADVIQSHRVYPSDYAIVTHRARFNQFITTGWYKAFQLCRDGTKKNFLHR
jgi:hypothetical protein